jgi:hypothetical protein
MAVGKISVSWLLCGILCWLFASPAFAATVDVTMSNLTFQAAAGNNSCSGLPCTETFDITFDYDTSTGLNVGTVNVSGTGALSAADISGPWSTQGSTDGLGHYFLDISEFTPAANDYIVISDTDLTYGLSGTPASGGYPFADAYMNCFENSTECYDNFVFVSGAAHMPGTAICGSVSVGPASGASGGSCTSSATPLPATLPLFAGGLGLLGLIGWRKGRKLKVGRWRWRADVWFDRISSFPS